MGFEMIMVVVSTIAQEKKKKNDMIWNSDYHKI